MAATARYMRKMDKVGITINRRSVLCSWHDAAELLAELQVMFDERTLADDIKEEDVERDHLR